MKKLIYITILLLLSLIVSGQNQVVDIDGTGGTGGNPVLSGVDASDTTRWGSGSGNPVLSGVDENDTTRWGQGGNETDPTFGASVASEITAQDTTNWNEAYGDTISLSDVIPLINYDSLQGKIIKIDSLLMFPSGDTLKDAYVLNDSVMAVFNEDTLCWLGCSGTVVESGDVSANTAFRNLFLYDQTFDDTIRLNRRETTYNRIKVTSTDTILVDTTGALNGSSGIFTLLGDTNTTPYFDTTNMKLKGNAFDSSAINYYSYIYQDSILFLNNYHTIAYAVSVPFFDSLTFLSNNKIVDDGAGGWTGDDASVATHYGVFNEYLADGDAGYFQFYYASQANGSGCFIGMDASSTNTDYTGYDYGGLQETNSPFEIYYVLAGSFAGNGTGTNSDDSGEWLRMDRSSSNVLTLQYSTNGTDFSVLHSFGTVTGDLYLKINIYDNSSKIEDVVGSNLTE